MGDVATQRGDSTAAASVQKLSLRRRGSRTAGRRLWGGRGYLFVLPALIYLGVMSVYPMVSVVVMSFGRIAAGGWSFYGFNHYVRLLQDPWFWNSIRVTVIFTLASTILHLLVGLVFALLLNEAWFSIRFRNIMRGIVILPWVFSTAASALMWALLFHPFGLLNFITQGLFGIGEPIEFLSSPGSALASLVMVNTWKFYPFYMITILGALQSIPLELYDAAKVDGAGGWRRLISITLPQIRGILVVISTFDVITSFGHVDFVRMLTRGGPFRLTETTAYYVYKAGLLDGQLGYGAAISTLLLVILALLTLVYLRLVSKES